MDWLNSMNKAIEYIEDNITEKIDIKEIAKIALSSEFHFQRMYYMITGVTISEYIRRRRLSLAAQDLFMGARVTDVAFKYGYESLESFSKAFKKMHGINPSKVKKQGVKLISYPKLSFHISLKGEKSMDYKIEKKKGFKVIGKQKKVNMNGGENFKVVPMFWDELMKDGSLEFLGSKAGKMGVLGVCKDFDMIKNEFNYMIAVEDAMEDLPKWYIKATIPDATWAIFESIGPLPESIQTLTKRIFTEWLPSSGYQHACAPELEVYYSGDTKSEDYRCEVWIPINK